MKKRMKSLLLELLKDSHRSDRQLAKVLGVSQPTVTRMRTKLVKEGIIREFTVIPDFAEMGFEIMSICSVKTKTPITQLMGEGMKWIKNRPNIIFAATAEGTGKSGVVICLHKNFTDFNRFVSESLKHWGEEVQDYSTILISLKEKIPKPLSLKYLAELEDI